MSSSSAALLLSPFTVSIAIVALVVVVVVVVVDADDEDNTDMELTEEETRRQPSQAKPGLGLAKKIWRKKDCVRKSEMKIDVE